MKKLLLILTTFAVITIAEAPLSTQAEEAVADTVAIGWFGPLSGPVASLGEDNLRGVQLAIKEFGARRVRLLVEDDRFTAKDSLSAYEKLKSGKVFMMMSPTYNGVIALASKANRDKMFLANSLDASSEIAKVGEYVLGLGYYADGHGNNFAQTILHHGAKRVAVFYNEGETFTQLIVDAFKENYRGNVVLIEGYSPSSTDFRSSITKMKNLNVDTVLLIGWDESGFFVRQSEDLSFTPSIFGLASFTSPGFLSNAGRFNLSLYYLGWDAQSKEYQEIVRRYQEQYGESPSQPLFVALGYDAMTFILKALDKGASPEQFRKNIYSTSFRGLTGDIRLDNDGIVRGITSQSRLFKVEQR
jgi:branched-chain amino acid transport system substrate-binding protein